jgi:hypothetical protein
MPNEPFFSYTLVRTSYIQWNDDDEVCFVLDQHANWIFIALAYWNNNSHRTLLEHIIVILNQAVFSLLTDVCLVEKQQIPII